MHPPSDPPPIWWPVDTSHRSTAHPHQPSLNGPSTPAIAQRDRAAGSAFDRAVNTWWRSSNGCMVECCAGSTASRISRTSSPMYSLLVPLYGTFLGRTYLATRVAKRWSPRWASSTDMHSNAASLLMSGGSQSFRHHPKPEWLEDAFRQK